MRESIIADVIKQLRASLESRDPVDLREAHTEVQEHLLQQKRSRAIVHVPQGKRVPISGLDAHKVAAEILDSLPDFSES